MTTLQSSLRNYSPAMLRAIAEANGVELASNQASQMIEQLAALLRDADHVRASLAACTPAAQQALAGLLREEGRSPRPAFERSHGVIRPAGPARLERERPHLTPANPTEELWYRGLLHPTMVETANGLMEFLGVPPELASLLPSPPPAERVFPPAPLPAAPGAVSLFGVLGNDQPERCSAFVDAQRRAHNGYCGGNRGHPAAWRTHRRSGRSASTRFGCDHRRRINPGDRRDGAVASIGGCRRDTPALAPGSPA